MDRVIYVWGGDMDFGFLEFRATHDFGANNVHNSILDPHEVWTPCTISVYHGFVGCIPLTHRICWDSADQWWFSHDQEGLCFDSKEPRQRWPIIPIKIWFNWLFLSHNLRYVSTCPQLYRHFVPTSCCLHRCCVGDLNFFTWHGLSISKRGGFLGSGSNGCALGDVGKFLPSTTRDDALGLFYTEFGMTKSQEILNTFHFLKSMMICSASSKYPNTSFWMLLDVSLRLNDAQHRGKTKTYMQVSLMDCLVLARSGCLGYATHTTLGWIRKPLMVRVHSISCRLNGREILKSPPKIVLFNSRIFLPKSNVFGVMWRKNARLLILIC